MIRFRLNGEDTAVPADEGERLLDVLRGRLHRTGTKESCREGDCGACVVLVGAPRAEGVRHRAVCSCLVPMADVEGRDVVTIEGFAKSPTDWVRRAMREEHAVQCGYCTPGIVVALEAYLLSAERYSPEGACAAVAGQLCRCTGYASIRRACERLAAMAEAALADPPPPDSAARIEALESLGVVATGLLARTLERGAARATDEGRVRIAGGTDYLVEHDPVPEGTRLALLAREESACTIRVVDDRVELGAGVTFEDFVTHRTLRGRIPALTRFEALVASPPIRARATLAGNVAHASPVGDASVLLLALDAELRVDAGGESRTIRLDSFFLDYRKTALPEGARILRIDFRLPSPDERISFEKVGKRAHLDIASVCTASTLRLDGDRIVEARVSAGGIAPVPRLLAATNAFLRGRVLDDVTAREAMRLAESEATPIDDIRGSATYKRRLLGRLVLAHLLDARPALESLVGSLP